MHCSPVEKCRSYGASVDVRHEGPLVPRLGEMLQWVERRMPCTRYSHGVDEEEGWVVLQFTSQPVVSLGPWNSIQTTLSLLCHNFLTVPTFFVGVLLSFGDCMWGASKHLAKNFERRKCRHSSKFLGEELEGGPQTVQVLRMRIEN